MRAHHDDHKPAGFKQGGRARIIQCSMASAAGKLGRGRFLECTLPVWAVTVAHPVQPMMACPVLDRHFQSSLKISSCKTFYYVDMDAPCSDRCH
jgi:hypothetical protein